MAAKHCLQVRKRVTQTIKPVKLSLNEIQSSSNDGLDSELYENILGVSFPVTTTCRNGVRVILYALQVERHQ